MTPPESPGALLRMLADEMDAWSEGIRIMKNEPRELPELPELPSLSQLAANGSVPALHEWAKAYARTAVAVALASQPRVDAGTIGGINSVGLAYLDRPMPEHSGAKLYLTPPLPSGNAALVALIEKLEPRTRGFRSSEYGIGKQAGIKECIEAAREALTAGDFQ